MQVKIGVQNVAREIIFESDASTKDIKARVADALEKNSILELTDDKGATIIVPAAQLAYIELGAESKRRIGFGIGE